MNKTTWKEDPMKAGGLVLGVILACFIGVWSVENDLTALEKMWAVIIGISTVGVMMYFTGTDNRRTRQTNEALAALTKEVASQSAQIKALKAMEEERRRNAAVLRQIARGLGMVMEELKVKGALRSGYAAGFVDGSDDDPTQPQGNKLRILSPRNGFGGPKKDDHS